MVNVYHKGMKMVNVYLKEWVRRPTTWETFKSQTHTIIQVLTSTLTSATKTTTPWILWYITLNNNNRESLQLLGKVWSASWRWLKGTLN